MFLVLRNFDLSKRSSSLSTHIISCSGFCRNCLGSRKRNFGNDILTLENLGIQTALPILEDHLTDLQVWAEEETPGKWIVSIYSQPVEPNPLTHGNAMPQQ